MGLTRRAALYVLGFGILSGAQAASAGIIVNADVTALGDPVAGVAATLGSPTSSLATVGTTANVNNYPSAESPNLAIDNNAGSKYLNFQKTGAGLIVTLSANGPATLTGVRFTTANDAIERDPTQITIEGTNSPNPTTTLNSAWSPIYSGVSGLASDPGRLTPGALISFVPTTVNPAGFTSYRLLVTDVRTAGTANSFQFGEVELIGNTVVPEPASLGLLGLGGLALLRRRGR
jgi:hypothetical protein